MQEALNVGSSHEELFQRRRHRRVAVALEGRFMLSDGSEHRCTTRNVSPGGVEVSATVKPKPDEKVIAYIDVLGRIEGKAVRITPDGFALKCSPGDLKRDRLATQLTWLINKDALALEDQRKSEREVAGSKAGVTIEAGGTRYPAEIIDFSLKGIAFRCEASLKLGQLIRLNQSTGVIVRLFPGGYGAAFTDNSGK